MSPDDSFDPGDPVDPLRRAIVLILRGDRCAFMVARAALLATGGEPPHPHRPPTT